MIGIRAMVARAAGRVVQVFSTMLRPRPKPTKVHSPLIHDAKKPKSTLMESI